MLFIQIRINLHYHAFVSHFQAFIRVIKNSVLTQIDNFIVLFDNLLIFNHIQHLFIIICLFFQFLVLINNQELFFIFLIIYQTISSFIIPFLP